MCGLSFSAKDFLVSFPIVEAIPNFNKELFYDMAKSSTSKTIQTLHPEPGKTNKKIDLEKYEVIKKHLLKILRKEELTHTELMEQLYQQVKDFFEGGVQWYGETVKLDLEARQVIERTREKPVRYRLKK